MYHRIGAAAYKADIASTVQLMEHLSHPERQFRSIHVAGTNGKGSVSHLLASIFQEAGYNVGLYTSPHLVDMRERIRINGQMIPQQAVVNFVERHHDTFQQLQLSFFEMMVGMAFDYFAQKVDIAIIEVGMGGRLDSTNVISPELSVITNIGFDHTQFLGTTLPQIATEKAGIIKPGTPVVIGESHPETRPVFQATAQRLGSPIVFADDHYRARFVTESGQGRIEVDSKSGQGRVKVGLRSYQGREKVDIFRNNEPLMTDLATPLAGAYQLHNFATLFAALEAINHQGRFHLEPDHIRRGIAGVVNNTGLHGRWEVIATQPLTVCETAHNEPGVRSMLEKLTTLVYNKLHIVYGCVVDKDLSSILSLMPRQAKYYFTQPSVPRRMPVEQLAATATASGLQGEQYTDVLSAIKAALAEASADDLVLITGSIFLIADTMAVKDQIK